MLNKRLIIVKGSGGGGLGDRLKSALLGLAYAKNNNRAICIDWADKKLIDADDNVFDCLFLLKDIDSISQKQLSEEWLNRSVYPKAWKYNLTQSLHTLYSNVDATGWDRAMAKQSFSFNQCHHHDSDINKSQTLVMWDFDKADVFAKNIGLPNALKLYQTMAQQHLCFRDELEAYIVLEINRILDSIQQTDSHLIGVHIRMTHEFSQQKDTLQLQDYVNQINKIIKKQPKAHLFIATDNVDIQNRMKEIYQDKVYFKDKWFAEPGEKLHFNDTCPDKLQAIKDATIEMGMLARCHSLIYQYNSSFGECAHILSAANEHSIFPLRPKQNIVKRFINKLNTGLRAIKCI